MSSFLPFKSFLFLSLISINQGSCGVSVLVRDDTLYVCNVGDSRVLLGSRETTNWSHKLLTNDHNTRNERERELVKARTSDPIPIRTDIQNIIILYNFGP